MIFNFMVAYSFQAFQRTPLGDLNRYQLDVKFVTPCFHILLAGYKKKF